MTAARETAYAKLNLALHIRGRRADKYHDLETLFAFCAHGDVLSAAPADELSLAVTGPFAGALCHAPPRRGGAGVGASGSEQTAPRRHSPALLRLPTLRRSPTPTPPSREGSDLVWRSDADNLVLRAARALAGAAGVRCAAHLTLDKRLPVASGIGGGSADAAAALRLLNRMWNTGFDARELARLAAPLGADVPACVTSRTMRGEGVGNVLTPLDGGLAGTPVLLVNPGHPVSTRAVFAAWDGEDRGALAPGEPMGAALAGRNDLELPAKTIEPAIGAVLGALVEAGGAVLARMSGSGATCFGLYADAAARDAAAAAIAARRADWWIMVSELR